MAVRRGSALAFSADSPSKTLINSLSTPLTTSFAGAQAQWWPCAGTAPPRIFVLFIPGNPGLSSYYTPYLSCLYNSQALRGKVEILALSHRGQAPLPHGASNATFGNTESLASAAARGERTGLAEQIRHKIAAVDAIRAMYPRPGPRNASAHRTSNGTAQPDDVKLILLGHSIGCYMALETLKARPDAIDGVHMLFPAVANIGKTPQARKLRLLVHPLLPSLVLSLPLLVLSLLPAFVVLGLVRLLTKQPAAAARTTADLLLTPGAVFNCLKMATEEFRDVGEVRADTLAAVRNLTKSGGVVRSYWGEDDHWAPAWLRDEVCMQLELEQEHLPPAIGRRLSRARSFSVSESRSKLLYTAASATKSVLSTASSKVIGSGSAGAHSTASQAEKHDQRKQQAPPSPVRKRTRPFHMRTASASRAFDGSIIIEPPPNFTEDDDDDDEVDEPLAMVLEGDGAGTGAGGVTVTPASRTGTLARGSDAVKGALASTICEMGIPHAFCLNHGVEMARITAHWLKQHL